MVLYDFFGGDFSGIELTNCSESQIHRMKSENRNGKA
jgi:hypothetical protein